MTHFFKIKKAISYFLTPFISSPPIHSPNSLIRRPKSFTFTSFYSSLNKPFLFPIIPLLSSSPCLRPNPSGFFYLPSLPLPLLLSLALTPALRQSR